MSEKYFVQVSAPNREALAKLQQYDLDLFRNTARETRQRVFSIHGLLTMEEVEQLVKDGYAVLIEQSASAKALGPEAVVELPEWLAERGF